MTPAALLIDSFTRIPPIIGKAIADLSSEQLAYSPAPGTNTIAWLAWHTARGQDVQIADLADTEQIWTASGWYGPSLYRSGRTKWDTE